SPMVGRDAELTALVQVSDAVRAGLGRVVVVIGEPGFGKSRLIAEWKAKATQTQVSNRSTAMRWAEGRCLSYGQGLGYHLLLDLLRSLLGVSATEAEPEVRAALLRLTGDLFGPSASDVYP